METRDPAPDLVTTKLPEHARKLTTAQVVAVVEVGAPVLFFSRARST